MRELVPEISTFLRVVHHGSFAAAAAERGITASGVSRMMNRLEQTLGATLLLRSTRALALTSEGEAFIPHAVRILAALEAAEAEVSSTAGAPTGQVRINCGTAFAHHRLAPALPDFYRRFPGITLDISVSDQRIAPIAEQADITVRVGDLEDSTLVALPLGRVSRVIAASPAYLAAHGTPTTPMELSTHNCLLLRGFPQQARWPFKENGRSFSVAVGGNLTCDSAQTLLQAAVAGVGIIRLGDFLGAEALASGALVEVLTDSHVPGSQSITALVPPGRQRLPRVRAVLDFLKAGTA